MTSYKPSDMPSAPTYAAPVRILIADDDAAMRYLLAATLEHAGYKVLTAADGVALVQMAQEHVPDLLLIDLMMPHLDGFEAVRQLRHDTRTGHLPMLVVTARARTDDLVQGFKAGADDFIVKPFDLTELLARIQANLSRAARQPVNNSLTGLPGNLLLVNNLIFRLGRDVPFAVLYADLDNFKVFNDTYGFARGDAAIRLLAALLQEALESDGGTGDFIGHVGGDDFVVITSPDHAENVCQRAIALFDERVKSLYEADDLARGYLSGLDRHGVVRRFPLMALSIGVVSTKQRAFATHEEISQAAAEMKHVAKSRPGSNYAMDMRSRRMSEVGYERRGARTEEIILISNDSTLIHVLRQILHDQGYRVAEAASPLVANSMIARADTPPLLIADAQLGANLQELYRDRVPHQPLLLIAEGRDKPLWEAADNVVCLHQPFAVDDLVACIEQLLDMSRSYQQLHAR